VALGVLLGVVAPRLWDLGKEWRRGSCAAAEILPQTPVAGERSVEASTPSPNCWRCPQQIAGRPGVDPGGHQRQMLKRGAVPVDEILQQYSGGLPEERRTLLGCPRSVRAGGGCPGCCRSSSAIWWAWTVREDLHRISPRRSLGVVPGGGEPLPARRTLLCCGGEFPA
jgi:hypothetical protein